MKFFKTSIEGIYIVELEPAQDKRGSSLRTYSLKALQSQALETCFVECLQTYNKLRGTIRGLHYQIPPNAETKLVRCLRGAIYDVAVDIRPSSPTFRKWLSIELTEISNKMLYISEGIAHGYQTLIDGTEVFYHLSAPYHPKLSRGIRWNDKDIGIAWPLKEAVILSERDSRLPSLNEVI